MDFIEVLKDNWINFFIIFAFPIVGLLYRNHKKIHYFDNIIKYADILEKTPQPAYQKDYLNNIKKKLLWEKVCFYQPGDINKEHIAISLINADKNNIINLNYLDSLTSYFSIQKDRIVAGRLFLVPEVIMGFIAIIFTTLIFIANLYAIFHFVSFVSVYIALLTVFVLIITAYQFGSAPIKRVYMFHRILCDHEFLARANHVYDTINERQLSQ